MQSEPWRIRTSAPLIKSYFQGISAVFLIFANLCKFSVSELLGRGALLPFSLFFYVDTIQKLYKNPFLTGKFANQQRTKRGKISIFKGLEIGLVSLNQQVYGVFTGNYTAVCIVTFQSGLYQGFEGKNTKKEANKC